MGEGRFIMYFVERGFVRESSAGRGSYRPRTLLPLPLCMLQHAWLIYVAGDNTYRGRWSLLAAGVLRFSMPHSVR